jgi:hypothetical protein
MATYRHYDDLDGHMVDELLDDRTVEQLLAGRLDRERAEQQALSSFITTLRSASTHGTGGGATRAGGHL